MAAASIGSAVYGGIKSSQANKEAQRKLAAERAETEAEHRRRINEDYLDTSAGQNLVRVANNAADKIYKREAGAAAVTGATERTAMAKQYGNNLVGEAIADISANDTARKDNIDARYEAREHQLNQQQVALDQQRGQNTAAVAGQISSTLGSLASAYAGTYMGAGSPGGGGVTAGQPTSQLAGMGAGSPGGGGVTAGQPTSQLAGMGGGSSYFENFAKNYARNMYGTSQLFPSNNPLLMNPRQFFGMS
jgi:hypothetical protein